MRLLRIKEVVQKTGLSPSSIYKQIRLGNFPRGVKITSSSRGWSSDDIDDWIKSLLVGEGREDVMENAHD